MKRRRLERLEAPPDDSMRRTALRAAADAGRQAAQRPSPQDERMNPEVDALKHFFAAVNRNDMQAMVRDFDPQIVRTEPAGFPTAGTYRGIAEVQGNVRTGRGTWAEGSCETEKFLTKGDKVVVYLHAWVRLKGATDWTGGRFADGFAFRNGKIIEYHSFAERAQALEWAGIHDPELG